MTTTTIGAGQPIVVFPLPSDEESAKEIICMLQRLAPFGNHSLFRRKSKDWLVTGPRVPKVFTEVFGEKVRMYTYFHINTPRKDKSYLKALNKGLRKILPNFGYERDFARVIIVKNESGTKILILLVKRPCKRMTEIIKSLRLVLEDLE